MSHFIKHISCDNCGSSDARAVYSDGGSHCFSCGQHGRAMVSPYVLPDEKEVEGGRTSGAINLPSDTCQEFPEIALQWFSKYELFVPDLIKAGVLWSEYRQQIIYPFYAAGHLEGYQARNFSPNARTKYYTKGNVNDILPVYYKRGELASTTLVVVEDCASAIKLSRFVDAIPCLGSDFPLYKITRVSRLYPKVLIWLDGNMYHKAQNIARRFQYLEVDSHAVYTSDDPKEIPYKELGSILNEF